MSADRSVEITVDAFLRVKSERDEARQEAERLRERYEPTPEQMAVVAARLSDLMADTDDDPIDALTVERDEARAAIACVRAICDAAYGPGREDLAELVLSVLPEES